MATATKATTLVLFNGENSNCYLDLDKCRDIVNHGMAQGVSGFIYNHDLIEWFDENDDEIESELNCYVEDIYSGEYCNYIHWLSATQNICDHLTLKQCAVWAYVVIKCAEFVSAHDF